MSANTIGTVDEAALLPGGQWVLDSNGTKLCLIETHMGWHQRMWMVADARRFLSLSSAAYPVHLADFVGECGHTRGHNECGYCYRCGQLVGESNWQEFAPEDLAVVRAIAEHNSRLVRGWFVMTGSPQTERPCCDLHGRNCEPPWELCCGGCTEDSHDAIGFRTGTHADGTRCSRPDLSSCNCRWHNSMHVYCYRSCGCNGNFAEVAR